MRCLSKVNSGCVWSLDIIWQLLDPSECGFVTCLWLVVHLLKTPANVGWFSGLQMTLEALVLKSNSFGGLQEGFTSKYPLYAFRGNLFSHPANGKFRRGGSNSISWIWPLVSKMHVRVRSAEPTCFLPSCQL